MAAAAPSSTAPSTGPRPTTPGSCRSSPSRRERFHQPRQHVRARISEPGRLVRHRARDDQARVDGRLRGVDRPQAPVEPRELVRRERRVDEHDEIGERVDRPTAARAYSYSFALRWISIDVGSSSLRGIECEMLRAGEPAAYGRIWQYVHWGARRPECMDAGPYIRTSYGHCTYAM